MPKMFEALSRLFTTPKPAEEPIDTKLAVAALLVHLAAVDGVTDEKERESISGLFQDHFDLTEHEVEKLIKEATRLDHDAVDFYKFTATLSKLEEEERINIIRLMWQVVYADGENHEMEDNMVWRVAELIGVSSRQRTILRSQMKRD
jgi:uncharacterized tellurite resistance protein B-like protein